MPGRSPKRCRCRCRPVVKPPAAGRARSPERTPSTDTRSSPPSPDPAPADASPAVTAPRTRAHQPSATHQPPPPATPSGQPARPPSSPRPGRRARDRRLLRDVRLARVRASGTVDGTHARRVASPPLAGPTANNGRCRGGRADVQAGDGGRATSWASGRSRRCRGILVTGFRSGRAGRSRWSRCGRVIR
jgi:hypothetical protein